MDYSELRQSIGFVQRSVTVYGKVYPQPRLTKWYGLVPYTYSNLTWPACPMPELLAGLRRRVEVLVGKPFNSVLCNLYRDGNDQIHWHADDEAIFGGDPVVASLSFGSTRVFKMKRRDGSERVEHHLYDGSLLVMGRGVQKEWLHSVPKTKVAVGERINLTFRFAGDF